MASDQFWLFRSDILEVSIHDLVDSTGKQVDPSLFGSSRRKDNVIVATLFGILGRSLRRKNVDRDDKFFGSSEFKATREGLNSMQLENMAGNNSPAMIFPETPPPDPDEFEAIDTTKASSITMGLGKLPSETLQEVEKIAGPRLKSKLAGKFAKESLEVVRATVSSCGEDLGKVLGYGFLYAGEENEAFVREAVSSTVLTVADKKGVRKAFTTLLKENVYDDYVNSLRVPDWIQLYVKLATKLPNKSWQTLLNFLNIGSSGVSLFCVSLYLLQIL